MRDPDDAQREQSGLFNWAFWFSPLVDFAGGLFLTLRYLPHIIVGCLVAAGILIVAQDVGYSYNQAYQIMTAAFFITMAWIGYRWIDWN